MEFAVIKTGGKQYAVSVGDKVKIEKLPGDLKAGDAVVFDSVLLVESGDDTTIGTPFIDGAAVHAVVEKIGRAKKVDVVKYKAKSRYFKRRGHRQPFMEVKIVSLGERVEGA
jgi:large subunit ribosomal protein L21